MQAIVTHFIAPTNFRGSRVKARCEAGSMTFDWDPALDVEENHTRAALSFAKSLGWNQRFNYVGGSLPNGGYAFVACEKKTPLADPVLIKPPGACL